MKIVILVKDGMVDKVISDQPDVEVEVIDSDFECCNPLEKWNEAMESCSNSVYEIDVK